MPEFGLRRKSSSRSSRIALSSGVRSASSTSIARRTNSCRSANDSLGISARISVRLIATSFDSVERFLENFEIAGVASLLTSGVDPLLLQRILRWTVSLIEHAEDAGEWKRGKFVSGELVGHVVPEFVLRRAVPFLFLDYFKAAAFFRVGRIEYVREKFDAFAQAFDDAEPLVIERALDQLDHVGDVRGVRARDKCRSACDQFFHRVDGLIDRAGRVGFALEPDR